MCKCKTQIRCAPRQASSIVLVLVCLGGCSSQTGDGGAIGPTASSQGVGDSARPTIQQHTFDLGDGESMRYTLSLPANHDAKQPAPLILALHYGGQVTPFYGRGMIEMLIGPALGDLNAIVVAPDSIAGRWNNDKNEKAVLRLLEHLTSQFKIDRKKTLVTGFSMGGAGTWYFASRNQDLFSAALPIAGRPLRNGDNVEWKIPLYVIHSRIDKVVPLKPTQQAVEALRETGVDIELVIVDGLEHFNTPGFAEPLRDAAPWIRKVWAR